MVVALKHKLSPLRQNDTRLRAPPPRRPGQGLALVGYRGTGKSTVGRIVADRSNRTFVDADLEVEARAGRSVERDLRRWRVSPSFRDWEERTLAELIEGFPTAIVATGGGAVLREANRRRLRDFGFVVWLTAEPAELARRLESDPRGLGQRPALDARTGRSPKSRGSSRIVRRSTRGSPTR